MQQIINFLIKNKYLLLYLFLLFISLTLTVQSHSYHRSKFINSANFLSGGLYNIFSNVEEYFNLKDTNLELKEENSRLREELFVATQQGGNNGITQDNTTTKYFINSARVIKNSYDKKNNIITIKGGTRDGITQDMGVITSNGIVGIIDNTSSKFSTVLSILHENFQTSARLKNTNHYGTLSWDGNNPNIVQITDIQQQAPVSVGDTLVTSGRSAIFPEGIPIGTVLKKELDNSGNFYTLAVTLLHDMTNLDYVYIIKNEDKEEILSLEQQNGNE